MGWAKIAICATLPLAACSRPMKSNDTVFVSNEAGGVTLVDGATGRIEGQLATGPRPRGMAFSPDRRTFYVAASKANRIEAWDVRAHKLLRDATARFEVMHVLPLTSGEINYIAGM